MYSKERAQQIVKKDVKYIPAGIQENVALDSARVGTSPSGRNFIEIKDGLAVSIGSYGRVNSRRAVYRA